VLPSGALTPALSLVRERESSDEMENMGTVQLAPTYIGSVQEL